MACRRIVICGERGRFALSDEARALLADRGHADAASLPRDHQDLVEVVEHLGVQAGPPQAISIWNPRGCAWVVVEIPVDVDWVIEEYDGLEWVAERHRRWDVEGELQPDQHVRSARQAGSTAVLLRCWLGHACSLTNRWSGTGTGFDSHLGGQRPIDVLHVRAPAEVLAALDALGEGALGQGRRPET